MEQKLILEKNNFITYKIINNNSTADFDILYLHGFCGDMDGSKGSLIENIAKINNLNLIKLNYLGHGTSSGEISDFVLTDWLNNIRTIINNFTNRRLLLVGSSMGAWLSYLIALENKERIKGIITIAGAVDFLTKVIEPQIKPGNFDDDIVFEVKNSDGTPSGGYITKRLLIDSKQYNLFEREKIDLECPIRMFHGMSDPLIPFEISIEFSKKLKTQDVEICLIKGADHRFSSKSSSEALKQKIESFVKYLML